MQYMYALDLHRRACEDQEQVGRAQVLSAQDKYFRVLELQLQMQNAEVRCDAPGVGLGRKGVEDDVRGKRPHWPPWR